MNIVIIYCENQGAVALTKNPKTYSQRKNSNIQWYYQCRQI